MPATLEREIYEPDLDEDEIEDEDSENPRYVFDPDPDEDEDGIVEYDPRRRRRTTKTRRTPRRRRRLSIRPRLTRVRTYVTRIRRRGGSTRAISSIMQAVLGLFGTLIGLTATYVSYMGLIGGIKAGLQNIAKFKFPTTEKITARLTDPNTNPYAQVLYGTMGASIVCFLSKYIPKIPHWTRKIVAWIGVFFTALCIGDLIAIFLSSSPATEMNPITNPSNPNFTTDLRNISIYS